MVTNRCHMNCPLCCNRGYNIDEIPVVTVEELKNIDTICITGGEPMLSRELVTEMVIRLRNDYTNIRRIYVYTTGEYISERIVRLTDGLSIGPKSYKDWKTLEMLLVDGVFQRNNTTIRLASKEDPLEFAEKSHRLYVFPEWEAAFECIYKDYKGRFVNFEIIHRKWQTSFKPAPNSFFRRLPILF